MPAASSEVSPVEPAKINIADLGGRYAALQEIYDLAIMCVREYPDDDENHKLLDVALRCVFESRMLQ